jgi:hypothetical protein
VPEFNRRFAVKPASAADAHRPLGVGHNLAAILSVQHERVVSNDYTVRLHNRVYPGGKPADPGLRKGRVVVELRLDGTMALRFKGRYLSDAEVPAVGGALGASAPQTPRSVASGGPTPGDEGEGPGRAAAAGPAGVQPPAGRSGRTPAERYPPGGATEDSKKGPYRRAADHPWRRSFKGNR